MKTSQIQWCHSTINPVMGCDGCELAPQPFKIRKELVAELSTLLPSVPANDLENQVHAALGDRYLSEIYDSREEIAASLLQPHESIASPASCQTLVDVIRSSAKCYALLLGVMRAGHKGYADNFEEPKLFPGRMAEAARWGPPSAAEQSVKPWLADLPRLIFISDMGDALSRNVPFGYLKTEVIDNVQSEAGRRHVWLWLTKRPERMAQFAKSLAETEIPWPENLVAMTTVTSANNVYRVRQLQEVPSRIRGLSVEPLFTSVELPLEGIDWVIVGGGSDVLAGPFHVEWALGIQEQCQRANVAFFLKQFGRNPFRGGQPLTLNSLHGGDWDEWPSELKIRKVQESFRMVARL